MRLILISVIVIVAQIMAFEPFFMKDPAVSPDGNTVCFSYKKDLWIVPFEGGTARRLTSVQGDDSGPVYSPDGKTIAFTTNRDGYGAVYTIPFSGGQAKKVISGGFMLTGWFKDSDALLLVKGEWFKGNKLYRVNLDGSGLTDMNALGNYYGDLSKDNDKFVFCHNGDPFREKQTGSGNGSLHLLDFATGAYYKIYDSKYTERYPVYSKTGKGIYFARSDGERFQICLLPQNEVGKQDPVVEQLTDFDWWSARDISIAWLNDRMVFEYFDCLWTLDPDTRTAAKLEIDIKEDVFGPDTVHDTAVSSADRFYVSSLGNWTLFRYKFDLFAVPYEGGEVKKVTGNHDGISDFIIADDNETVFFSAYVKGEPKLYRTSIRYSNDPVSVEWGKDKCVEWIQNVKGKVLVYYSAGEKRNMLAFTDTKGEKFTDIETEMYVVEAELSPDGNYAFCQIMEPGLYRTDLYLYDLKKGTKEKIYTSTDWTSNFRLSPGGDFIFYTREGDIFRSETKFLSEFYFDKDKWKDIFDKNDKKKKDEKEPVTQFEPVNKDLRLTEGRLIKNPGRNYILSITKNKDIYYINSFEDKQTLRKTDFEAKNDEVVTEFNGQNIKDFTFCDSTLTLFYMQDGKIKSFEAAQKKTKDTPFNVKYDYSRQEIYWKVFDEAHSILARWFYDPLMHGVDWKKKGSDFSAYLGVNLDSDSFGSIIDEMVGDLNSSHTGFYPAKEPDVQSLPVASVGAEFDFKTRLEKGLTVSKVFDSSVLKKVYGIAAGDILLSIDGISITPLTDFYELLVNKTGEKISLEFLKNGKSLTVEIKGLDSDYDLKYGTWVNERESITDRLSDGKIGYTHIQGMSDGPLNKFIEDVFAKNYDKKALIIDVRYNGGGYTHDQLIELLTKRQYAVTSERWTGNMKMKAPSDIWDKPSVVLINNRSYSDAEIFPSLYREMGLGKIIGTPTTGDVIGTTHHVLMDGSSMRLPKVGWFRKDGTNMEGNGVQPDIYVEPTFTQLLNDDDPELKKAVELLLEESK